MDWIFDGIGTALVMFILAGAGLGSYFYHKSDRKNKLVQKQKGGKNSTLYQAGRDIDNGSKGE